MRILLDSKVLDCYDVEQFLFLVGSMSLYVTSVGLAIIWYVPFQSGCSFLEIPFCVLKIGIKTNVPIFKSVAGIKLELFWLLMFCLCSNFFVTFW